MAKLVKDDNPSMSDWEVQTSIPTSSFSPCEVVPVTLDIKIPISASPPCTNQQVFVRLTLLRRVFCRESSNSISAEDDWALGDSDESKELLWERYEKEDMELGQRWGVVTLPSSVTTEAQRHVQLKDIHLPLSGVSERNAGYSVSVDMPPSFGRPSLNHGESSWFSPVVEEAMAKTSNNSWNKYFHVSSRFYIAVEIGFFNGSASTTTSRPGQFVACSGPSPFVERKGMGRRFSAPAFPGKLRELLVPITVGSVSEPGQNWYQTQSAGTGRPINRDPDEWQGEERGATAEGEDGAQAAPEHQGHWMYAPPSFEEALEAPPSYQI